ncbi:hypothetical protein [Marinitoga aeolica]|uniref:Helix-turn-helix domain-containing protein n=1 Tax=Marinitoga aeolica TaxID=2809031 RepID=A0ABY8PQF0_9BACT|nr:hypothetical protein [Marinitoga aeolica]WGS64873.1 hypothetical protein JRV97_11035 [Marinitoga aeolica]
MFHLNDAFLMLPHNAVYFILTVRPANAAKIYIYLYLNSLAHSWKLGKARKYTYPISYRQISKTLEISYGITEQAIRNLKKMGAIEVIDQSNKGTIYKVNIPEWRDNEGVWHFEDPENSRTFYSMNNEIDTIKHVKTKIKENKIPLFNLKKE